MGHDPLAGAGGRSAHSTAAGADDLAVAAAAAAAASCGPEGGGSFASALAAPGGSVVDIALLHELARWHPHEAARLIHAMALLPVHLSGGNNRWEALPIALSEQSYAVVSKGEAIRLAHVPGRGPTVLPASEVVEEGLGEEEEGRGEEGLGAGGGGGGGLHGLLARGGLLPNGNRVTPEPGAGIDILSGGGATGGKRRNAFARGRDVAATEALGYGAAAGAAPPSPGGCGGFFGSVFGRRPHHVHHYFGHAVSGGAQQQQQQQALGREDLLLACVFRSLWRVLAHFLLCSTRLPAYMAHLEELRYRTYLYALLGQVRRGHTPAGGHTGELTRPNNAGPTSQLQLDHHRLFNVLCVWFLGGPVAGPATNDPRPPLSRPRTGLPTGQHTRRAAVGCRAGCAGAGLPRRAAHRTAAGHAFAPAQAVAARAPRPRPGASQPVCQEVRPVVGQEGASTAHESKSRQHGGPPPMTAAPRTARLPGL